jgi:hypothetical protein
MVALLGTDSDAAVARELGMHPSSVTSKRHRLGIPAFNPPPHERPGRFPWQPEHLALLGKVSDGELARTLGLAPATLTRKRQKLGIPPFQPAPRPIEWTSAMVERLGKASDARVAGELGIAQCTVLLKRQDLGIAPTMENLPVERNAEVAGLLRRPTAEVQHRTGLDRETIQRLRDDLGVQEAIFLSPDEPGTGSQAEVEARLASRPAPRRGCRWRPEEVALLATGPDEEIAARLGRSAGAVRLRRQLLGLLLRPTVRWRPHELELLGTAPDAEVAARLGRPVTAVASKRRRLGILRQHQQPWPERDIPLLGTASDAEVAQRLGRRVGSVKHKRYALGVPAFHGAASRRWTAAEEALVGTAADAEIARRIGRTVEAVAKRRRLLGRKRGGPRGGK